MSAPITIVIPTLNSCESLKRSLPPLIEGLTEGLIAKVIFADGRSTDGLADLAEDTGAEIVIAPIGRGSQLRAACQTVRSPWIMVIHADTALPSGWSTHIKAALANTNRAAVFRLSFDVTGLMPAIVAGWANLRTRFFSLPYGDQSLLISRTLYQKIDGYPDIPLMEDVAIARKLRGRISLINATVTTSACLLYTSPSPRDA